MVGNNMADIFDDFQDFLNSLSDEKISNCKTFDDLLMMVNFNQLRVDKMATLPALLFMAKEKKIPVIWKVMRHNTDFVISIVSKGSNSFRQTYLYTKYPASPLNLSAYECFYEWAKARGSNVLSYITPFEKFLGNLTDAMW